MSKTIRVLLAGMISLAFLASVSQADIYGSNLLTAVESGFEGTPVAGDPGWMNLGRWEIQTTWFEVSSTYAYEGSSSLKGQRKYAGGYPKAYISLDTVGNRKHTISLMIREPDGPVGTRFMDFDGTWITFPATTQTANFESIARNRLIGGSGVREDVYFGLQYYHVNESIATAYVDSVVISRERVAPIITGDSLAGASLDAGQATVVSFYADGTTTDYQGDNLRTYFDPDIYVSSVTNAIINSITWMEDGRVDVSLTAQAEGEVSLTLTNDYSAASDSWTLNAVPEPTTMLLTAAGGVLVMFRKKHI